MLLEAVLVTQHKSMSIELPSPVTPLHANSTQTLGQQEDQTPLMVRSEAEQLVGQQLIKALSNFKHDMVYPLSPHILQNTSSEREIIIGNKIDTQRYEDEE
jgi:hypothetical protein